MKKYNTELSNIIPFAEDGDWYLKLIYKYEDKKGKHKVVIPKAAIPFVQGCLPHVNSEPSYNSLLISDYPYIECDNRMILHKSVSGLAIKRGVKEPAYYFDIITEYATREMTLDEIEKELGYKVKIINKEKSDGNGKNMKGKSSDEK